MRLKSQFARGVLALAASVLVVASATVIASPASATTAITQTSPTTGTVDVAGSAAFNTTIQTSGSDGNGVTFSVVSSTPAGLTINSTTGEITATGTLAATTYAISGTDSDGSADTGNWSFTLTVTGDPITQTSPTTGFTTTTASATFQPGSINVAPDNAPVTFVTTTTSTGLSVSSAGLITTTGLLSAGMYTVSGTDSDATNDTGTWTYALTVNPVGGGGGGGGSTSASTIVQTSPTTGTTTTSASSSFLPPPFTVENNSGAVTFVTTTASTGLKVSASGVIKVTGALTVGIYTVSGTDSDATGDTGTWSYTLTVTGVFATVTFEANGGTGVMAPEKEDAPSALSINGFARKDFTFVDWNSAANGSGTSYANGSAYAFTTSITLYAQWKTGELPSHQVVFEANGGSKTMAVEIHNTATALSSVLFTRQGYTFVDWNTTAKGTGKSYANLATYSFKTNTTLYAQWKKNPPKQKPKPTLFTVTFNSNGGHGAMAVERRHAPSTLEAIAFKRAGYTFEHWNTKPDGKGNSYANLATYSFATNATLYAQWHHVVVVVLPAVPASATIGPFALKSSALSASLESQINSLAAEVKSHHDTKIALAGYGDKLSTADQLIQSLWSADYTLSKNRADAVRTYLESALAAIGVKSYSISAIANGSPIASSASSVSSKFGLVTAALT
jgi:uncharacterized repeat protein (TIGR02543 family)